MNNQKLVLFVSLLLASCLADNVVVTWVGTCTDNTMFGFQWSATNGGEGFKPDAAGGANVPCNEYFEVSFSVIDYSNNVLDFPAIVLSLNNVRQSADIQGNVIITIPPEAATWGSTSVSAAGAIYVGSGKPFNFQCSNNAANIRLSTNYMLTATNNNQQNPLLGYIRTLDNVTDQGNFGTGNTVMAPVPPNPNFNVGASMCAAQGQPVAFEFPTNAAFNPINDNAAGFPPSTALATNSIIIIVVVVLFVVVGTTCGIVVFVEVRRKKNVQ